MPAFIDACEKVPVTFAQVEGIIKLTAQCFLGDCHSKIKRSIMERSIHSKILSLYHYRTFMTVDKGVNNFLPKVNNS